MSKRDLSVASASPSSVNSQMAVIADITANLRRDGLMEIPLQARAPAPVAGRFVLYADAADGKLKAISEKGTITALT